MQVLNESKAILPELFVKMSLQEFVKTCIKRLIFISWHQVPQ